MRRLASRLCDAARRWHAGVALDYAIDRAINAELGRPTIESRYECSRIVSEVLRDARAEGRSRVRPPASRAKLENTLRYRFIVAGTDEREATRLAAKVARLISGEGGAS